MCAILVVLRIVEYVLPSFPCTSVSAQLRRQNRWVRITWNVAVRLAVSLWNHSVPLCVLCH